MNRRVPVEAKLLFLVARKRLDGTDLVSLAVDAADVTALRFGVDVIAVCRIGEHPEAVAAVHVLPSAVGDAARIFGIADPRAVVLKSAVDVIRLVHVHAHMVELRNRQILGLPPLVAGVVGIPESAVVAGNHVIRILWIDPDVVEIPVRAAARYC